MKFSEGFSKLWPSVFLFLFYGVAFTSLTLALKKIDLSVAYAIWSGAGTALTALIGLLVFGETFTWPKILCLMLVIVGVIGLRVVGQGA